MAVNDFTSNQKTSFNCHISLIFKVYYKQMDEDKTPIELFRQRCGTMMQKLREATEKLKAQYTNELAPSGLENQYSNVSFELGHELGGLELAFQYSLKNSESLQRFLSGCQGSIQDRQSRLVKLTNEYPNLITHKDIKPLLDHMRVIERLANHALSRCGGLDKALQHRIEIENILEEGENAIGNSTDFHTLAEAANIPRKIRTALQDEADNLIEFDTQEQFVGFDLRKIRAVCEERRNNLASLTASYSEVIETDTLEKLLAPYKQVLDSALFACDELLAGRSLNKEAITR